MSPPIAEAMYTEATSRPRSAEGIAGARRALQGVSQAPVSIRACGSGVCGLYEHFRVLRSALPSWWTEKESYCGAGASRIAAKGSSDALPVCAFAQEKASTEGRLAQTYGKGATCSPAQTEAESDRMLAKLPAVLQCCCCCAPREVGDNETFLRMSSRSWMRPSALDASDTRMVRVKQNKPQIRLLQQRKQRRSFNMRGRCFNGLTSLDSGMQQRHTRGQSALRSCDLAVLLGRGEGQRHQHPYNHELEA